LAVVSTHEPQVVSQEEPAGIPVHVGGFAAPKSAAQVLVLHHEAKIIIISLIIPKKSYV